MQRAVIAVFFLLSFIGTAEAQYVFPTPTPTPKPSPTATPAPGPAPCPTVGVQGNPGQRVRDGQIITFTANIAGGDPKVVPTIVWSTTAGSITRGHNTRRIEVDTTGAGLTPDRELRAEVWVGGYAPECLLQASGTVKIIPPAVKYGEFGMVDDEKLKRNLEEISTFLAQSPDNLYLIAYAGRNSERGFAYTWLRRMKEAIVAPSMSPRRVLGIDGGFREEPLFEFWLVPVGADPPRPTPTLRRSDIVQPNTGPGRRPGQF
jgi:hypothetical protein